MSDSPEKLAREAIDLQIQASGRMVQSREEMNISAGMGVARVRANLKCFRASVLKPADVRRAVSSRSSHAGEPHTCVARVARKSLNLEDIRPAAIPLASGDEQLGVIGEVEQRLSMAEKVEALLGGGTSRSSRLSQSILKRAFEGKLVPRAGGIVSGQTKMRPEGVQS